MKFLKNRQKIKSYRRPAIFSEKAAAGSRKTTTRKKKNGENRVSSRGRLVRETTRIGWILGRGDAGTVEGGYHLLQKLGR